MIGQITASQAASVGTNAHAGRDYHMDGWRNSNHFVWIVVSGAEGQIPFRADRRTGWTPGLCGGGLTPRSRGYVCNRQ